MYCPYSKQYVLYVIDIHIHISILLTIAGLTQIIAPTDFEMILSRKELDRNRATSIHNVPHDYLPESAKDTYYFHL